MPQETAFDHLRKTLYRLRQRLEESIPAADLLIASCQHLQLDATRFVVDVWRFQTLLTECDRHPHRSLATCNACLARLADPPRPGKNGALLHAPTPIAAAHWQLTPCACS